MFDIYESFYDVITMAFSPVLKWLYEDRVRNNMKIRMMKKNIIELRRIRNAKNSRR